MIFLAIHIGHNATVALSINGKIISVISEERITRIKNFTGFPNKSIEFIKKKFLNNDLSKINKFIFIDKTGQALNYIKKKKFKSHSYGNYGWINKKNYFKKYKIYLILGFRLTNLVTKIKRILKKFLNTSNKNKVLLDKIIKQYPEINFDINKAIFYDHHETHALSFGYFKNKNINKSLIFTMDGEGDFLSSTVSIYENNKLNKLSKNLNDTSLGYFYAESTKILGLKPFEHEFKVMGMAPYAKKEDVARILKELDGLIVVNKEGNFETKIVSSLFQYELEKIFKYEKFENICGAVQQFSENLIVKWIEYWMNKTSLDNLVLSGGVFMNIKACKKILEHSKVKSLFIVPSASDESLPFGALYKINKKNNQPIEILENLYVGRSFKNNIDDFVKKIDTKKFKIKKFNNIEDANNEISKLLAENKILARCCENEEWGARALGNRSIICNPSDTNNIKHINSAVKHRDYWMPFSPSILDNYADKYFFNPKKVNTKFMTCLFDSTEIAKSHLRAAIHPIDYTMRPQVVYTDTNPGYYDLINKFKNLTGIGGLLNTSFNLHGEPNVSDYSDAIHTLSNSKLKYLQLEHYLIEKIT